MQRISPAGFAVALVILTIVWMFLPSEARFPLFLVLILGALAATKAPVEIINRLFGRLK